VGWAPRLAQSTRKSPAHDYSPRCRPHQYFSRVKPRTPPQCGRGSRRLFCLSHGPSPENRKHQPPRALGLLGGIPSAGGWSGSQNEKWQEPPPDRKFPGVLGLLGRDLREKIPVFPKMKKGRNPHTIRHTHWGGPGAFGRRSTREISGSQNEKWQGPLHT